jgi:VWFA-related protein
MREGFLIAFLGFSVSVKGQEVQPGAGPPARTAEAVGVDLVNLEVYATDASGQPVAGLKLENFEVLEDGKPVAITHFSRFEAGRPVPSPAALEASVESGEYPVGAAETEWLHVVLYFDYSNIRMASRGALFRELDSFLAEYLKPEDRVMIVTFDHERRIQRSFRSGAEILLSDFEELEKLAGRGAQAESERRLVIRQIEQASVERIGGEIPDAKELANRVRSVAASEYERIGVAVRELQRFTDSLAGLPGRKAIVYVGDGLPTHPGRPLFEAWNNKFSQFSREAGMGSALSETRLFDTTPRLRELVAHANASRVTFHTIDASASQPASGAAAEQGGFDFTAMRMRGAGRVFTSDVAVTEELESRGGLEYLARATGGQSAVNNAKLAASLRRIGSDLLTFYSLAYRPPHPEGGKFHEIRVRTRREGVRLRHRTGYYGKSAEERTVDLTLTALQLETVPNPLQVRLEAGPQEQEKQGVFRVPIVVKIPIPNLALIPGEGMHVARLSLFLVTEDDKGRRSALQKREVPVRIPAEKLEAAKSQVIGYPMTLHLREGGQRVAVGIRDEQGGVRSGVGISVWVGNKVR